MANDDNNNQIVSVNSDNSMVIEFSKLGEKLKITNYMELVEKTGKKDYLDDAKHINDVFSKCYNTTSVTQIYTYRTLEKDFSKIEKEEDKSNGIVEFFKRVDSIKNLPANLKVKHEKIAMKINQMKRKISYKYVLMALESGDVADIIKKMDLATDIDGCQECVDDSWLLFNDNKKPQTVDLKSETAEYINCATNGYLFMYVSKNAEEIMLL